MLNLNHSQKWSLNPFVVMYPRHILRLELELVKMYLLKEILLLANPVKVPLHHPLREATHHLRLFLEIRLIGHQLRYHRHIRFHHL